MYIMCAVIMCASFIIMFILVQRSEPQGRHFTTFHDYCCYYFLILWIHTLVMSGTSSMDSPLVHELVSSQWYGRRKSNLNSTAKVRLTP